MIKNTIHVQEYIPGKERKILTVFDDMTADMLSNKNLNPIVSELFISAKPYSLLVIDTTLVSDNPLHFRKNILVRI